MHKGRYSKYIKPISYVLDLISILLLFPYFFKGLNINYLYFGLFLFLSWTIVSFSTKFYQVFRFTTPVEILTKIVKQAAFYGLVVIAFFPFYKQAIFSGKAISLYLLVLFTFIILLKTLLFYYLKKYRLSTGNNYRNVVIVGYTEEANNLKKIFEERDDYGYRFKGFFSDKRKNKEIIGKTTVLQSFCIENKIDEIYCSLNEISNDQMKDLVEFSDDNQIEIKFIPDSTAILSKKLKTNYYELFPVLTIQKTPLHDPTIQSFKRLFDILFSLIIFIFILSWLAPILAILIKIESKGPVFFKQSRPGIDEVEFSCYKFRSMQLNGTTESEASKNDPRVTKIGRFIRKTSIDEMPQFFNVLKGEMSVVGPRPHLWSQNVVYGNKIKKYMVRHYVKPGVTGLAQVKGYRGEIETDDDMINRIKFDVFYIENWSFIMDIKIIIQTIINVFKGQDKAY
jgi:putative colanic acid biosynthesis UDP-glucose lipid carrier transferase